MNTQLIMESREWGFLALLLVAKKGSDIDILYEGKADILLRSQMKIELEKLMVCSVDIIRKRENGVDEEFKRQINKDVIYV